MSLSSSFPNRMVTLSNYDSPVEAAHRAIHQPGAQVQKVLKSLPAPPLHSIPSIDQPTAKIGQWVKYTAMVQDIWDTEIFVAASPDRQSGLLVENAAASNHPSAKLAERLPIYLVSLPGETSWVRKQRQKDFDSDVPSSSPQPQQQLRANKSTMKRPRDPTTDGDDVMMEGTATRNTDDVAVHSSDKRSRPETQKQATNNAGFGLNLPVHNQLGASAVVAKLYDNEQCRQVKINSLVEVVGILQEGLDINIDSQREEFAMEFAARNPKNVKRLHVVHWRELELWETHPLTSHMNKAGVEAARRELQQVAAGMREVLVRYLASVLYGDVLAAEYLLMCLVSKPSRIESETVLGKLSVNIVLPNVKDSGASAAILGAVRNLLASVVEVPISIAGLNSFNLFPKKDYELNRLKAGVLQLAPGTCLFGNECALSNGRLADRGVKNVRALTSLSSRCVIPIDFEYYEAEMAVDCCSVFVSNGCKSIIPTDTVIRVREQRGGPELQKWDTYDGELVKKMRLAVALLREDGQFDICDEAAKEVEKVYVEARKEGQAQDGQDTLQKWLSVARCCARSFGETSLTAQRWMYAVNLERARKERTRQGVDKM